jgi:hypothetical protein
MFVNIGMRDATHSNIHLPSSAQADASKCFQSTMQAPPIIHNPIGESSSVRKATPDALANDCEFNGNATRTNVAMPIEI